MTMPHVQPANCAGAWEVDGFHHRAEAKLALRRAEELRIRLNQDLDRFKRTRKSGVSPNRIAFDLSDEYRLMRTAAVVFSALAVEGFLNYYGVRRLGEVVYSKQYERLSLPKKVAALASLCEGKSLSDDSKLILVTQRIAEARNALVHPKARDAGRASNKPMQITDEADLPQEMVRNMEVFFNLFSEVDPVSVGMMPWQ